MCVCARAHVCARVCVCVRERFYLLGSGVARSPSPAMHNAGFAACELPHEYSLFDTPSAAAFAADALANPNFGGASVTIPHKVRARARAR